MEIAEKYNQINFPEYQRESNVWGKNAKCRLIDSIIREFDISPLYFYTRDEDVFDCVDGRQRIGAIMSFLYRNEKDPDQGFKFNILNELYEDSDSIYKEFEGKDFLEIKKLAEQNNKPAEEFIDAILNYELTIVMLSDSNAYNEFNLQFARLNLGYIINSGEKLNAMVGDLRDACFDDLGKHTFLQNAIKIPERRFSREQTAAQILAQVFNFEKNGRPQQHQECVRTRHFDLQKIFKEHTEMTNEQECVVDKVKNLLNLLSTVSAKFYSIRSRALVVSTVMLAYKLDITDEAGAKRFGKFINIFARRLRWQVKKGIDIDQPYRYLIDFQSI